MSGGLRVFRLEGFPAPGPPFRLSCHPLGGGAGGWVATLPFVQLGPAIEHGAKVYVPLGRPVAASPQKDLCWVSITINAGGVPVVSEPVDVPYEACPELEGLVVGGSPSLLPSGGAMGHTHPSSFALLRAKEGDAPDGLAGHLVDMLSLSVGNVLCTTPMMFGAPEIVVFNPVTGTVLWRKQGWAGNVRERYQTLFVDARNKSLCVHYERWEYSDQHEYVAEFGTASFLASIYPVDADEDGVGDSFSETGLGWGWLPYWIDGNEAVGGPNRVIGDKLNEAIAVADHFQAYWEARAAGGSLEPRKLLVRRTQGYRLYRMPDGLLLAEKSVPLRGPCIKNALGQQVQHRISLVDSYRVERRRYTEGQVAGGWPTINSDTEVVSERYRIRIVGPTGGGAEEVTLQEVLEGTVLREEGDEETPNGEPGDIINYALVQVKRHVAQEFSKRLPWRSYELATDGERICNGPGMHAAHTQTILSDNQYRGRVEVGGGDGGGDVGG